jgi:hypothetical protein
MQHDDQFESPLKSYLRRIEKGLPDPVQLARREIWRSDPDAWINSADATLEALLCPQIFDDYAEKYQEYLDEMAEFCDHETPMTFIEFENALN